MTTVLDRRLALARQIMASHYNQPATGLWRVFECEVVQDQLRGPGRGLDLGCGDGELAHVLFARIRDVQWTGLDIDPFDAALARRSGVYDTVHAAPAGAIPEPDEAFDLVFANSAVEHMDDLDGVLSEVHRVLRPGGRFVATVPSADFHRTLLWPELLRRVGARDAAARYVAHLDKRLHHVNMLSESGWAELLQAHGLHVTAAVPYLSARVVDTWETLSNCTGGAAYLLSGGKMTPRKIQQSVGVVRARDPLAGALVWGAMLPILYGTGIERHPDRFGCLYLEATRRD